MQALVIAALLVANRVPDLTGRGEAAPWWMLLSGAAAYVAATYAVTRVNASRGLRRLMRGGEPGRALGRGTGVLVIVTQVYMVGGLAVLMLAGWGQWTAGGLRVGRVPLAGTLLGMAPFVAALVAHLWAAYPLERAVRDRHRGQMALAGRPVTPTWTRGQFLDFSLRYNLLFILVPAGAIILVIEVLDLLEPLIGAGLVMVAIDVLRLLEPVIGGGAVARAIEVLPPLEPLIGGGAVAVAGTVLAAGVFLVAPAMVVRVWRTRPMPGGGLHERLERACRRIGLTYRDIRIWETGGVIVNAGVMGLIRRVRYVLLSDGLLEQMDESEVESVFAHEAGHIVHRHILYMVIFTLGLMLVCTSAGAVVAAAVNANDGLAQVLTLVTAATAWGWLFGLISRRFEWQADVYAASVTGGDDPPGRPGAGGGGGEELTPEGVRLFSESLLAVARLNGIPLGRRNYRHGSIRWRVTRLGELLAGGAGRAKVDRSIARIKAGIWLLLAGGVAAAVVMSLH